MSSPRPSRRPPNRGRQLHRSSLDRQGDDIRAIKRLAAAWRAGWLAGDADALLSLYADRPVLMPQGRPAIVGKSAIRPLYRAVFKAVSIRSTGRMREVVAAGDWGYFWSTYNLTATPKAGGRTVRSRGKSVFILQRTPRGQWRIARLIDNSDCPP